MTRWSQDVPHWPPGLRDELPLPYQLWRVMDLVDGYRTLAQLSGELEMGQEDVERALEQVQSWVNRASKREQVLNEDLLSGVTQALVSVIGPIGEFAVDDALDDVGEDATLSQLLSALAPQLAEQQLHQFVRQLRARGLT